MRRKSLEKEEEVLGGLGVPGHAMEVSSRSHGVRLLDGLFRVVFQCLWRKVITSSFNRAMNITLIDGTTLESVVCSNRTSVSNTPAFERAPDCSLLTQFAYLVSLVAVPL